ncbi:hypothetical protein [Mesonia aestuariivivens]|uniref:Uncharacterized protein n=1 Tax=Mesonia aestuariivivens TaxID=2796128 RepID=A0ABS6W507_9FLAO|nr:hypothetical protein [Mesonia aestuariivivens]MBW2962950.1 hypothetical protein [Mesonia aestuariivivens]
MAHLDKHNRLIGGLGNLVFKQVNGKTIVQLKPGKNNVKQTKRSKQSASDFGTASRTTKCLSVSLRSLFQHYYDGQMFNRFRKTVYQAMLSNTEILKGQKNLWESDSSLLDDFEFNLASLYSDYSTITCNSQLTSAQEIKLDIAAFNPKTQLKWPATAQKAKLCFLVSTYAKEDFMPLASLAFKVEVNRNSAPLSAQNFLTDPLPSPCFVLISTCVLYFKEDPVLGPISLNHKTLHPAKIEKAFRVVG